MFKKFIIITLLTALSVRPAFYVGNVLYYETHLSEIIEKYCVNKDKPELQCNGQCHLAKQLNPVVEHGSSKATVDISTAFFPVFYQEIKQDTATFIPTHLTTSHFKNQYSYYFLMSKDMLKPPIV
ncbi:hypothetical protein FHR24_002027 [Wenyingzhuangia heitensis]|uniref:Uncharacterized protein n=1 Tax=Wenyingzhuangia heitensis TaxID=1487859 RepID=A0ABX0U9P3_9FLAO|nr:hypothetical protein [Wenyingzhuangia heitensis]NIJ45559.1 hypothetical protein [Wenyingzhuangia heitensis]